MRKITYTKCQLVRGTEEAILELENGCIVYKVRKDCYVVSETWWESHAPPVKVSTSETNPDQSIYLKSQSWVKVRWCPDAAVTLLAGEEPIGNNPPPPPPPDPTRPTVWLPPNDVIWGTAQVGVSHEGDGDYRVSKTTWDRRISPPPATQKGCIVTAYYKRYWKVTRQKLPNGEEKTTEEPYLPETITPKQWVVPGCEEKTELKMAGPSLNEEMRMLGGRDDWRPTRGMWVLGTHVRVKFEVPYDAGSREQDLVRAVNHFVREELPHCSDAVARMFLEHAQHVSDGRSGARRRTRDTEGERG